MSNARKLMEKTFSKALACGMLRDNERILFLMHKDAHGIERIELPSVEVLEGEDPVQKLTEEFKRQTGIDAEIREIKMQKLYNAGSRRKKHWIPCIIFSMRAKNMSAKPSSEFSGFKWLTMEKAKTMKLARKAEWLR